MKINCRCGATIRDNTDFLPHKAHLIPDQDYFAGIELIDTAIVDAVAGRKTTEAAQMAAMGAVSRYSRWMWQCSACGRLYIDDPKDEKRFHCYAPDSTEDSHTILRGQTPRPGAA